MIECRTIGCMEALEHSVLRTGQIYCDRCMKFGAGKKRQPIHLQNALYGELVKEKRKRLGIHEYNFEENRPEPYSWMVE